MTFSDVARAAYCPRQLYYARREEDREPPPEVERVQSLAFRYPELREASDAVLGELPVAVSPGRYRRALEALAGREVWDGLVEPCARNVLLEGRDCRGVVGKLLECGGEAPVPSLLSPGRPPEQGVWEPQRVRAVAAAKAVSWEHEAAVERAVVEYPAYGVVRTVRATTRNRATYRLALRTVRGLDGPPPRLRDDARCEGCAYRGECGVETRSLRSRLGL